MAADEAVSEHNGVVGFFDFLDGFLNSNFELLLGLNTGSESASEFFEGRRVDEKEVTLNRLGVKLESGVDIAYNNRDKVLLLNLFDVAVGDSVIESIFSSVHIE